MPEYAALISIDWADRQHAVSLYDQSTSQREQTIIKHTPADLQEWALGLRQRFAGRPIAVCLEQSRGPLIYALLQYDFLVLYPINPATLAKYRQAFSTALGKDDPSDADYLLDLLQHHRERLRAWRSDDEKTRTLRLLVEQRRRLINDRTRVSNRLTALLKGYFPQVLDWFDDIRTLLVCDFLARWPELSVLQRVKPATLNKFFRSHHSTSNTTNQRRLAETKTALPLTFHEYAAQSIQDSFWARAYYAMQRAKGKEHHAAVRALAFKWIRIIWKCWQTHTPYNEVIYLESLRKKGSSLLKFAADYQQ